MKIKKYWMMFAIALVSLCTVSCGGDDDDEPIVNPENPVVDSLEKINEYVFPGGFDLIYEKGEYVRVGWHNNQGGILDNPSLNISSTNGIVIKAVDVGMFSSISDIKNYRKKVG